jgi:hypothetical protein
MSLQYFMRHATEETYLDITYRCRTYQLDVKQNAEEGSVGISTLVIDDPDGDLDVGGWRVFYILESEAEDPDQQIIYVGHSTPQVQIKRGPYRVEAGRQWEVQLADVNNMLERRLMLGGDNDRPDETDNARIAWVLGTDEGEVIGDTRYVTSDNPFNMDENDYLGQATINVYRDCGEQSGKNYFLTHFGDVGPYPFGDYSLFYEKPEELVYVSSARLTNLLSDVDQAGDPPVFAVTHEPVEFTIDHSRVGNRVYMPYNNGYVTATRQPGTLLPYRDLSYPAANVNTKATAQTRANRMLAEAVTPEHRATLQFYTSRAKVNAIREGMLVEVKMTHWPEPYASEYVYMRVLTRQITDVSEQDDSVYLQTIEVSRSEPGPPAEPVDAILYRTAGPYGGALVWFDSSGDDPEQGLPGRPTSGLLELLSDPGGDGGAIRPYYGIKVLGTGTVDIEFFASTAGVLVNDTNFTITYSIRVNGAVVASENSVVSGNLEYMSDYQLVTATGVSVMPDDEITATISCVPGSMPFFRTPQGAGQANERLAITGGSLS